MAERTPSIVWGYRALFAGLVMLTLFLRLLPMGSVAGNWPGPDLVLCLTLAWVLRRPDYVPALLIAVVVLMEDLLLMRPPGLWAAVVVLAAEFLRNRGALTREVTFMVEWLLVATVMTAAILGYRFALMATMLPQAGLAPTLVQLCLSVLCYPLVVGFSRVALGVRKPSMGEIDAYGRRI